MLVDSRSRSPSSVWCAASSAWPCLCASCGCRVLCARTRRMEGGRLGGGRGLAPASRASTPSFASRRRRGPEEATRRPRGDGGVLRSTEGEGCSRAQPQNRCEKGAWLCTGAGRGAHGMHSSPPSEPAHGSILTRYDCPNALSRSDASPCMAEWSKAADSSSAIVRCVGSNPTGDIWP